MKILAVTMEHFRQGDLLKYSLKFLRFKIRCTILSAMEKDWRGLPLVQKGIVLYRWTTSQKHMWKVHPRLVLRALELDNNVICSNRRLMDLVFAMQYSPGFTKGLLTFREMCNIYLFVRKVSEIHGDIAEAGVYRGGSAKIICEAKREKPLHLFDTFSGLPVPDRSIDILAAGEMKDTSLPEVRNGLAGYPNVFFHEGLFPQTAEPVRDHVFSFVHLDTDLYRSTKDCLEFFYERMSPGGIILSHDYNCIDAPGVRKAFDEFFSDKPETIIEIWDSQCLIIKH